MDTQVRTAVERWASTRDLPPDIADSLEAVVPWIFGGEGFSANLARDLMAEAIVQFHLSEDDVRSLADWVSHLSDYDEPPVLPEGRLESLDRLRAAVAELNRAYPSSLPGYLHVPWYADPELRLEVRLHLDPPLPKVFLERLRTAMEGDRTISKVLIVARDGTMLETLCCQR